MAILASAGNLPSNSESLKTKRSRLEEILKDSLLEQSVLSMYAEQNA
jgi:hypothetical protein